MSRAPDGAEMADTVEYMNKLEGYQQERDTFMNSPLGRALEEQRLTQKELTQQITLRIDETNKKLTEIAKLQSDTRTLLVFLICGVLGVITRAYWF